MLYSSLGVKWAGYPLLVDVVIVSFSRWPFNNSTFYLLVAIQLFICKYFLHFNRYFTMYFTMYCRPVTIIYIYIYI